MAGRGDASPNRGGFESCCSADEVRGAELALRHRQRRRAVAACACWSGDVAPDFEQESTQGRLRFHEYIGKGWGVLFSRPADFTPVCTTELGYTAKLREAFARRNVKVVALSVDPVDSHRRWIDDIEQTQQTHADYPIVADADRKVSTLYDMIDGNGETALAHVLSVARRSTADARGCRCDGAAVQRDEVVRDGEAVTASRRATAAELRRRCRGYRDVNARRQRCCTMQRPRPPPRNNEATDVLNDAFERCNGGSTPSVCATSSWQFVPHLSKPTRTGEVVDRLLEACSARAVFSGR